MILLLLILSSLPALILGDCGWEEMRKEIASERKDDAKNFGCRSCSNPVVSAEAACPVSGFECREEWQITSNVLTPGDNNRCSQAKCAGKARLASDRNIIKKMSCIDRKWTVDDDVEAEPVVCAKPCHSKICSVKYTETLPDFEPLKFHEAGKENACAVGYCEAGYTPTIINEDGNPGDALAEGMQLTCTGDGLWKANENRHTYVMCKKNPSKTCNDCDPALIAIIIDADAKPMQAPIDTSEPCTKILFACGEPNALNTAIQINGGTSFLDANDGSNDGVANFPVVCDASGTSWEAAVDLPITITSLKCTFTPAPPKTCMDCDPELIVISTDPDTKPMQATVDISGPCKTIAYACGEPNALNTAIQINGGADFQDSHDGTTDGVANFQVVCDASGTLWMWEALPTYPITSLKCSFTPAPQKTCKDCDIGLITVNTVDPDTIPMEPTIDDSGACKKATFTCGPGSNTVVTLNGAKEIYDHDDNDNGDRDGTTHFEVVCNDMGNAWMYARDTSYNVMTLKCTNI